MKKTILAGVMVVAFCITFLLVFGSAWQQLGRAMDTKIQERKANDQAWQTLEQADKALKQVGQGGQQTAQEFEEAQQALKQAEKAVKDAEWEVEHTDEAEQRAQGRFSELSRDADTQFKWGIGAGLLVDVLLLVGALAWSKLTTKE